MKKKRYSHFIRPLAFIFDIITLNISLYLAYLIKFQSILTPSNVTYYNLFLEINIAWIVILISFKTFHSTRINFTISVLLLNYLKIVFLLIGSTMIFYVLTKGYFYSREFTFYTFFNLIVLGFLWRVIGVYFFRSYRKKGNNIHYYAIAGGKANTSSIKEYFENQMELGFHLLGHFNDFEEDSELFKIIKELKVDTIFVDFSKVGKENYLKIATALDSRPIDLKIIPNFGGLFEKDFQLEHYGYTPVINILRNPFASKTIIIRKRLFDIIFSLLVLILLSPIFIILGIITKGTSKGPIFFNSKRTGQWGVEFNMYKFRSMLINADEIAEKELKGQMHSIGSKDPRITLWGNFIRKTRLDELPQFWNVLRGNMSIVGPRPLAIYDSEYLLLHAPVKYKKLLAIKPGLTSIGQLNYGYASSKKQVLERLNYDLTYLKKYSVWIDLYLIILTVKLMLSAKGK